jgi:hypothetical protein
MTSKGHCDGGGDVSAIALCKHRVVNARLIHFFIGMVLPLSLWWIKRKEADMALPDMGSKPNRPASW